MKKIGFIGVGIMGSAMARNLMKAGFTVTVYSRTKAHCEGLLSEGAKWADTPAACAQGQDAVCSIVGYPKDVEQVYSGENGILAGAASGTYLIDMTTSDPALAQRIYAAAGEKGLHALDAPVTGGDAGAKKGTLTILVGGDEADFYACLPLLEAMGKNIVHMGPAGMGQHTKLCNQIAIAGALSGVAEALAYAGDKGLDQGRLLSAISTGAAGSFQMTNLGPKMAKGDYTPGFFLKHFVKDMALADDAAKADGLTLPMLEQVLGECRELEKQGHGDEGTPVLYEYYKK